MSTEIEVVRAEKESVIAQKVTLENKVRQLEHDMNEKMEKFEGIIREVSLVSIRIEGIIREVR
jgi:uncharacterized protein YoxC